MSWKRARPLLVVDVAGAAASPQIADRLVMAGLSQQEAEVLVYLFTAGPAKAGLIASVLKSGRGDVYRTLDRLVERDFVVKTDERPARYQAVAPGHLLDALQREAEGRLERIRSLRDDTLAAIEALRRAPGGPTHRNLFQVVRGRTMVYAAVERLLRDARHTVEIAATHPRASYLLEAAGLRTIGRRRAAEGVKFRALLRPDSTPGALRAPGHAAAADMAVRPFETEGTLQFIIVDKHEIVLWITTDPSDRLDAEGDVAICTDAKDLVRSHHGLFEAAWRGAGEMPVDRLVRHVPRTA